MQPQERLKKILEDFTPSSTVEGLTRQFEVIAQAVFNGHFVVNDTYEIHPIDIEFYFHDEKHGHIIDPQMYHKGDLPYFPIGAICPNRSGVDITFEREGYYRASFLIRGYTYHSLINGEDYTNRDLKKSLELPSFKPQYLWEDLFGNASALGKGLHIVWKDNAIYQKVEIKTSPRINIHKIEGEAEDRQWRFTLAIPQEPHPSLPPHDHIFVSDTLLKDYPSIYNELTKILTRHNISHGILDHTADYWCRDYMPVQVYDNEWIQFRYHPDYLKGQRHYETPTEVSLRLAERLTGAHIRQSSLIADGGNFTFATHREGDKTTPVVIMTDKIFLENPELTRDAITAQLQTLLPRHKFLFLPWDNNDEKDPYGHTDGIVHPIGENRLLVNLHIYPKSIARKMREILESYFELVDLELSYYPINSWAYINMIQTRDVIIVPGLGLKSDMEAFQQICRLFPQYEGHIYQIPMGQITPKYGGALNCLSWSFTR